LERIRKAVAAVFRNLDIDTSDLGVTIDPSTYDTVLAHSVFLLALFAAGRWVKGCCLTQRDLPIGLQDLSHIFDRKDSFTDCVIAFPQVGTGTRFLHHMWWQQASAEKQLVIDYITGSRATPEREIYCHRAILAARCALMLPQTICASASILSHS
jgi:hypothetical protein